jgi:hypothetical protein
MVDGAKSAKAAGIVKAKANDVYSAGRSASIIARSGPSVHKLARGI